MSCAKSPFSDTRVSLFCLFPSAWSPLHLLSQTPGSPHLDGHAPFHPAVCPWPLTITSPTGSPFPCLAWSRASLEGRCSGPSEWCSHLGYDECLSATRPVISYSLVPSTPPRWALWAPFILRDCSVARSPHSALAQSVDRRPPSPHSRLNHKTLCAWRSASGWPPSLVQQHSHPSLFL